MNENYSKESSQVIANILQDDEDSSVRSQVNRQIFHFQFFRDDSLSIKSKRKNVLFSKRGMGEDPMIKFIPT